MLFNIFKKKSPKTSWPDSAKYQFRDFVRFRHRGELHFGFIHEARVDEGGKVIYTLQMGGECPTLIYNYAEDDIVGKVN